MKFSVLIGQRHSSSTLEKTNAKARAYCLTRKQYHAIFSSHSFSIVVYVNEHDVAYACNTYTATTFLAQMVNSLKGGQILHRRMGNWREGLESWLPLTWQSAQDPVCCSGDLYIRYMDPVALGDGKGAPLPAGCTTELRA